LRPIEPTDAMIDWVVQRLAQRALNELEPGRQDACTS
jgi:hypothetical protein